MEKVEWRVAGQQPTKLWSEALCIFVHILSAWMLCGCLGGKKGGYRAGRRSHSLILFVFLGRGILFRAWILRRAVRVPICRRCRKKKKMNSQNWRRVNNKRRRNWRKRKKWMPVRHWPSIWKRPASGPDSPPSASHFRPSTFAIAGKTKQQQKISPNKKRKKEREICGDSNRLHCFVCFFSK